ncbi:hypothetical protein QTO17_10545 [Vibrio owensii]
MNMQHADALRKVTRQLFDESKIILTAGESPTLFRRLQVENPDIEPERTVAVYLNKFIITLTEEGKWELLLDRSHYVESDLSQLEEKLFSFLCEEHFILS